MAQLRAIGRAGDPDEIPAAVVDYNILGMVWRRRRPFYVDFNDVQYVDFGTVGIYHLASAELPSVARMDWAHPLSRFKLDAGYTTPT